MNTLKEKILSRGYWLTVIRPSRFVEKRIPNISDLYPIIRKNSVSLRGWDFPHLDSRNPYRIDIDWIGEDFEWEHHLSSWRFYQSGQFIHLSAIAIDWRDQSSFWPADENWEPNKLLGVGDVIFNYTEIIELGSRLALSDAGDEAMHIEIKTGNLQRRTLYMDDPRKWGFFEIFTTKINEFPYIIDPTKTELITNSKSLAVSASIELFKRFGWNATNEQISSWQEGLIKQR